jgi:hypothetical protein
MVEREEDIYNIYMYYIYFLLLSKRQNETLTSLTHQKFVLFFMVIFFKTSKLTFDALPEQAK